MRIEHGDAIVLEAIVRRVFSCDRGAMGGYIDAGHFESQPFDAALIALAPLWQRTDCSQIENFLLKWEYVFRKGNEDNVNPKLFINELDEIVSDLLR
ncbi:MAG: hypothetical protein IKA57_04075 [Clostridia bacterium]|nr:hypothetical protein [Clostridia bacterium]